MIVMSRVQPLRAAPSEFALRVYAACRLIPAGRVCSYGGLARAIGCGSARAVGRALRENPFAPEVPCHRVIAADGGLGGFFGETGGRRVREKQRMLEVEGVEFSGPLRIARPVPWHDFGENPPVRDATAG